MPSSITASMPKPAATFSLAILMSAMSGAARTVGTALRELVQRDNFICDITGDRITVDQAMLVRAGEFRRSPLVAEFRRRNPDLAELFLARNWSDWIVRADLLD